MPQAGDTGKRPNGGPGWAMTACFLLALLGAAVASDLLGFGQAGLWAVALVGVAVLIVVLMR